MKFNLDDLPELRLDTTDESADWLRGNTLSYYCAGDTLETYIEYLDELGIDLEQFKQSYTFRAAFERGEPDWIGDL